MKTLELDISRCTNRSSNAAEGLTNYAVEILQKNFKLQTLPFFYSNKNFTKCPCYLAIKSLHVNQIVGISLFNFPGVVFTLRHHWRVYESPDVVVREVPFVSKQLLPDYLQALKTRACLDHWEGSTPQIKSHVQLSASWEKTLRVVDDVTFGAEAKIVFLWRR